MRYRVRPFNTRLSTILVAALTIVSGAVFAQKKVDGSEVPDYAGAMAAPLVEKNARTGEVRGLTAEEVDARARKSNPKRGQAQRAQAAAVNRTIDAMPATAAEAQREQVQTKGRGVTVLTSREEILPVYGMQDANGKTIVTHSPGAEPADHNAR